MALERRIVVFCNPEHDRAKLFEAAHRAQFGTAPLFIPWIRAIRGEVPWAEVAGATAIRIDSPGKNWLVEKEILMLGAEEEDEGETAGGIRWRRLSKKQTGAIGNDPGRVWPMRQWFLGWRRLLKNIETQIGPAARWMNAVANIITMFDKAECDARTATAGAAVPQNLGLPADFDDLIARMEQARRFRVFLKPCHGSSASGVVALEVSGHRMQAWSTLEMVGLALYNRRPAIRSTELVQIRRFINAVCAERAIAQVWFPKAGWRGQRVDFRVMVIGGKARHIIPRLSDQPMTNLQMGGRRGDVGAIRAHAGENWDAFIRQCERAFAAFPGNSYAAFDLLPRPDWTRAAIAEANAFGDLLPGCLHDGRDTYAAQLHHLASSFASSKLQSPP